MQTPLDILKADYPEIAQAISDYYDSIGHLKMTDEWTRPNEWAAEVSRRWPHCIMEAFDIADAAREIFTPYERHRILAQRAPRPSVSPALAGLINSKDSSWF